MSLPVLVLKTGADKRLKQGHLWIYSNEIDVAKSPLKSFEPGQQALLQNAKGKGLGIVMVSPNALIAARLVSRSDSPLDYSTFVHRFNVALSLRDRIFSQPYYRLVYGDSDLLPGLVIDRFGDCFVVQISNAGMECLKPELLKALEKVLKPKQVLFKNDGKMRQAEGLESYREFALGEATDEAELLENDVRFIAPIVEGQKTGWFYDHRMARARLKPYVSGKRVLDVFSYIGGWGVQAAAFGAESVLCVDSSEQALEYVHRNAELNSVAEKVETLQGDAYEACKQLKTEDERFDVVILDPPALIPRRKDIRAGERAYQKYNQIAMRLLSNDGILVSGSCSMHLAKDRHIEILRDCAQTLEKDIQILEQSGQGPDHPIVPAIPETNYLKSVFVRVLSKR